MRTALLERVAADKILVVDRNGIPIKGSEFTAVVPQLLVISG